VISKMSKYTFLQQNGHILTVLVRMH